MQAIFVSETSKFQWKWCEIAQNTVKYAFLQKKLNFIEYSTGLEYSGGHEKIFLNYKCVEVFPKKFSCQSDK